MVSVVLDTPVSHANLWDTKPDLITALKPGRCPFDHFIDEHKQNVLPEEDVERPSKRRRVDNTGGVDESKLSTQAWIPIASVSINFAPDQGSTSTDALKLEDRNDDIEVIVMDVTRLSESVKLSLAGPMHGKKGPIQGKNPFTLQFQLATEVDNNAYDILSWSAYLGRRTRNGNARTNKGIAKADCHLSRLCDAEGIHFVLKCHILWADGASALVPPAVKQTDEDLLARFYPSPKAEDKWTWSPQDFYDNVHVPSTDMTLPSLNWKVLATELYPFQKRAVAWMLDRENRADETTALTFSKVLDAQDGTCFISHLQGTLSSALDPSLAAEPRGGILAEEMGLGKTCELISLVCLHQRTHVSGLDFGIVGELNNETLIPSRATLIVTPATILQQWEEEIRKHAPHLSVMHYTGIPTSKRKLDERETLQNFATMDIVLTTCMPTGKFIDAR